MMLNCKSVQPCAAEKMNVSSGGGNSGSKTCKRCVVYGRVRRILRSARVWYLTAGLCWCIGKNVAPVSVKMFSHLIYFIKKFQFDLQR
jgi:hypothetical protein